jgi:hypothetical protein
MEQGLKQHHPDREDNQHAAHIDADAHHYLKPSSTVQMTAI